MGLGTQDIPFQRSCSARKQRATSSPRLACLKKRMKKFDTCRRERGRLTQLIRDNVVCHALGDRILHRVDDMSNVVLVRRMPTKLAVDHVVELVRPCIRRVLDLVVPACARGVQREEAAAALPDRQSPTSIRQPSMDTKLRRGWSTVPTVQDSHTRDPRAIGLFWWSRGERSADSVGQKMLSSTQHKQAQVRSVFVWGRRGSIP